MVGICHGGNKPLGHDDAFDAFDVHHHLNSSESDLDRMAERKNEAESIPT